VPDSLPPVAKSSSDPELRPSEGSDPGTVDRLIEAPQLSPLDTARCLLWLRRRDVIDTRESEALTAAVWYLDRLDEQS